MSHEATSWAVKLRGLKPTTKVILWHLCDRHNPDYGCFPSQARLAYDAEVSRATLNRHLDELEQMGLIRRIQCINPKTKRQEATRYILAFEDDQPQSAPPPCLNLRHGNDGAEADDPCLNSGHGAVSQKSEKPCLKSGESRVSNCDTNLVREPLREPVTRAGAREAGVGLSDEERAGADLPPEDPGIGPGAKLDDDPDAPFAAFWSAYPDPCEREAARRQFMSVLDDGEISGADLVAAAQAYSRSRHVERGYGKKPANWLSSGAWRETWEAGKAAKQELRTVDLSALAERWRGPIKAGQTYAASAVSQSLARFMLEKGTVTEAELRRCGVAF